MGLLAAALSTAACASAPRQAARDLARDGAALAGQTQQALTGLQGALDTYIEGQYLLGPLSGRADPEASLLTALEQVDRALGARAAVMARLASAYRAWQAHAERDAADEVEREVAALAASIDLYAGVLGMPLKLATRPAGWLAARAAGALAGRRQARELQRASRELRGELERVAELAEGEHRLYAGLQAVLGESSGHLARALWRAGLARADGLIASHVTSAGLVYPQDGLETTLARLAAQPSLRPTAENQAQDLRTALETLLARRAARRAQAEAALVDETVTGLRALVAAHHTFEAGGGRGGLADITRRMAALRAGAEELARLRAAQE